MLTVLLTKRQADLLRAMVARLESTTDPAGPFAFELRSLMKILDTPRAPDWCATCGETGAHTEGCVSK